MPGSGDRAAAEIWGTWEELLLAYAVRRHGVHRWDSVAMEVKERIASSHLITPEGCEKHFRHLQRRFAEGRGGDPAAEEEADEELPLLEELRRLRVAELRRELERRDVSITSLQHKVKRLKEERERSEREAQAEGGEEPDLKASDEGNGGETPRSLPTNRVSDGDSGRSCNESNSTDPKEEKPAMLAAEASDPAAAAGDEKSCNGSSEANPARTAADWKVGARESSEGQSSASLLSRRRLGRRRKTVPSGRVETEADAEVSPVNTRSADIKSGPLMAVLEMIRSSEHGSVFERRLQSQESSRYRELIRRHVDLETVRSKLESGAAYSSLEFFRDLFLLCANATLFYTKRSPQSTAALHLRRIITNQMATALPKPCQPSKPLAGKKGSTLQQLLVTKLRSDSTSVSKPLDEEKKTASLPPLLACRKRSSMNNSKVAARVGRKEDKTEEAARESEEENPAKKRSTKERSQAALTGTKGLRNNKNPGGDRGGGRSATPTSPPKPTPRIEDRTGQKAAAAAGVSKGDKKNINGSNSNKKGGSAGAGAAAELLSRMKQRSPAGTAKSSPSSTRGGEQKKGVRPGGGGAVTTRQTAEKGGGGGQVKRGVGRPPKRTAKEAELAPRKRGRR